MIKGIKIIAIIFIMFGIVFSISNFVSIELKAKNGGLQGVWVDIGGVCECTGDGNECDFEMELP